MKTVPIDIPIKPLCCNNKTQTRMSPPSSCSISPPSKYILLQGGPFNNKDTVNNILTEAIPDVSKSYVSHFVDEVNLKGEAYIRVNNTDADNICRNLVDNGLYAKIIDK
jgi:hypothetical protein